MKKHWEKFENGDKLTKAEITGMIQDTEIAIQYLRDRGDRLVVRQLCKDLNSLELILQLRSM